MALAHTIVDEKGLRILPAQPVAKKKLVRRIAPDRSQPIRRAVQLAFVALNAAIAIQFYFWVRFFETGGGRAVARPAGVEGYLPIAGLMNLKAALLTGHLPSVHPAGMFLLVAFLAISLLLRKAFCSWLCPVGTLSEYLWRVGRKVFGHNLRLPRWLDLPLRGLKYLLLAFFVFAVANMGAAEIGAFMQSPYGLIADVKMLNFFRYLGGTAAAVLVILIVASLLIQNFWCRYLCPYGALMGLAALASPLRIRRRPDACIDCGKCARACPSGLPVDTRLAIGSAECTACLECVAACPAQDALILAAPQQRSVPPWAVAAAIAVIFLGVVGFAKLSGHWNSDIPRQVYFELIPSAGAVSHPMPADPASR